VDNKILVSPTSEDQELIDELIEITPGINTPEQALLFTLRMFFLQKAIEKGVDSIKKELERAYGRSRRAFRVPSQPSPHEMKNTLLKLVEEIDNLQSDDSIIAPQNPSGEGLRGITGGGVGSDL
jgi:hypothetical protein